MNEKKTIKVSGTKAAFLNQAVQIKKRMKKDEAILKDLRNKLGYTEEGFYVTQSGATLDITSVPQYEDISPKEVLQKLKDQRKSKFFPTVVKVIIKELQNVLSDDEIAELRVKKDSTMKWTFK